jgi:hypothetical protein
MVSQTLRTYVCMPCLIAPSLPAASGLQHQVRVRQRSRISAPPFRISIACKLAFSCELYHETGGNSAQLTHSRDREWRTMSLLSALRCSTMCKPVLTPARMAFQLELTGISRSAGCRYRVTPRTETTVTLAPGTPGTGTNLATATRCVKPRAYLVAARAFT